MLDGVNVALGITGSIAAVKTVELVHELRRQGATVRAVMSDSARGIIHPWAVEFATEQSVVTELTGRVQHIELCGTSGWADVLLIAPATANSVGKIASAIDDTPVTTCATTALGSSIPVVIAPAMHEPMYDHPGVLDAIEQVESWGVSIVDPRIEEGKAKIANEGSIISTLARVTGDRPLSGRHVVVTSGATAEPIDPVRVLTNRSSGRMGRAVARTCYALGADVTVIHGVVGPQSLDNQFQPDWDTVSSYATIKSVERTEELIAETLDTTTDADALVSVAAIGDFTTTERTSKIRSGESLEVSFEPTPKLIDEVRNRHPDLPIVGFKAETSGDEQAMANAARDILERASLSFVVANDASVMGATECEALFVAGDDVTAFDGSKSALGMELGRRLALEFDDQ